MNRVEVLIFRHGETDWNLERRLQGHTNIPLNENGRAQARELQKRVTQNAPDVIVSSDLLRAKETAEIVNASLGLPLFISPDLRECMLGEAEGLLREELIIRFGEAGWERWLSVKKEDKDFGFPGGQTKSAHTKILINFLESFIENHPEFSKIAVSTHGGSLRRIVHYSEGSPSEPVSLENCALFRLGFDRETKKWFYLEALTHR